LFGTNISIYCGNRLNYIWTVLVSVMIHSLIKVFLIIVMIGASLLCDAQSLYNSYNMHIGKIESDGLVRDRSNMMIGKFRSDGTIENRNYMMMGKIERDGTIRNRSNMMIGKVNSDGEVRDRSNMQIGGVKSDGTVVDRSNKTIGYAKGVPATYAAVFFFFGLFE